MCVIVITCVGLIAHYIPIVKGADISLSDVMPLRTCRHNMRHCLCCAPGCISSHRFLVMVLPILFPELVLSQTSYLQRRLDRPALLEEQQNHHCGFRIVEWKDFVVKETHTPWRRCEYDYMFCIGCHS